MSPIPAHAHQPPSASDASSARPIHALISGLIDYAGLFPPAKLSMDKSAAAYAKYAASADAWMLGRFILPVSRIEEFRKSAAMLLPKNDGEQPWPISAIVDGDLDENLDSIFAFNHEHASPRNGLANIDAVEIKVPMSEADAAASGESGGVGAAFIDDALERMPEEIYPFFELPILAPKDAQLPDLRGCIAALSGADAGAKVRTGGLTPESIPTTRAVAEFLVACHAADVPFKATAGLHHAIRAEYDLTYEPACPRSIMHGFLNVFIAAAALHAFRIDADAVARILDERNTRAFTFNTNTVAWNGNTLDAAQLEKAREFFALSYGSCSFEEPTAELRALGLI